LKDTSGPSLNILVKLMAILSLVFATFFCRTGWLVGPFGDSTEPVDSIDEFVAIIARRL